MEKIPAPATTDLDMIRGVAALAVLVSHIRSLFFQYYADIANPSPLAKGLYLFTGFAHPAVMVFFVLSGYLVAGSAFRTRQSRMWTAYLANRLTRLMVVVVPCLILTAVLDRLSMSLPGGGQYFLRPIPYLVDQAAVERISLSTGLGNLFFLQTIVVPPFGSNSALWSLSNEFWYYLLLPPLVMAGLRNTPLRQRILAVLGLTGLLLWLPKSFLPGLGVWLCGAALNWLPRPRISASSAFWARCAAGCAFAASLGLYRVRATGDEMTLSLLGIAFALWLYTLLWTRKAGEPNRWYRSIAAVTSGCSFSLYAVHLPIATLFRCALPSGSWSPNIEGAAKFAAVTLLVFGLAYLFSRLTESHTDMARKWVYRRLGLQIETGSGQGKEVQSLVTA